MRANQFISEDHKRLDEIGFLAPVAAAAAGALTITGILTIIGVAWTIYDIYNILDKHDIGMDDLSNDPEEALNRISEEEWGEIGLMAVFAAIPGLGKLGSKFLKKILPEDWLKRMGTASKDRFKQLIGAKPQQMDLPLSTPKKSTTAKPQKKSSVSPEEFSKGLQKDIDEFMKKKGLTPVANPVKAAKNIDSAAESAVKKIIQKTPNKIKSTVKLPGNFKEIVKDAGKITIDTAIGIVQAYLVGLELRDLLLIWKEHGYNMPEAHEDFAENIVYTFGDLLMIILLPYGIKKLIGRTQGKILAATTLVKTAQTVKVFKYLSIPVVAGAGLQNVDPKVWDEILTDMGL